MTDVKADYDYSDVKTNATPQEFNVNLEILRVLKQIEQNTRVK